MSLNPVATLDFGTELFVDDALIMSKHGVTRTLHAGIKHETPVLHPIPYIKFGNGCLLNRLFHRGPYATFLRVPPHDGVISTNHMTVQIACILHSH